MIDRILAQMGVLTICKAFEALKGRGKAPPAGSGDFTILAQGRIKYLIWAVVPGAQAAAFQAANPHAGTARQICHKLGYTMQTHRHLRAQLQDTADAVADLAEEVDATYPGAVLFVAIED
jgi:hypothetical protein